MAFTHLREQAGVDRAAQIAHHRAAGGAVSDEAEDRKMIAAAVHKHEKHDHKGEPLTKVRKSGAVDGEAPKGKRLDRFAAGGRAKHKKGATTVNVIVAPGGGAQPVPVPHPVPVPVGAGPGGPPPGMPPGLPPRPMGPPGGLGAGAPMPPGGPMPMRARGGAVKMTAGAMSGEGRLEKKRAGYLE